MNPWLDDGDVRLWHGNAIECLRAMPAGVAQTCITSPPFWGLRSYLDDGHDDKHLELGLEESPEEWCARLVDVFREVRRVLRDDGTVWLEVGDSYAGGGPDRCGATGPKPKDLVGAPWLLAFALRADGWYLRSDIIWARPNPMPESITDRPTKSHSYVFLLTKRARYYWDADAIRESHVRLWGANNGGSMAKIDHEASEARRIGQGNNHRGDYPLPNPAGRNARSVWNIATEPTPFAHFATFPQALVERCILAGTSERGACSACGAPWARQTERALAETPRTPPPNKGHNRGAFQERAANMTRDGWVPNRDLAITTTGWAPTCPCDAGEPTPQLVLDPFMGSATTALVARRLGRHAIGCELNVEYLAIAAKRLEQLSLLGGSVPTDVPAQGPNAQGDLYA